MSRSNIYKSSNETVDSNFKQKKSKIYNLKQIYWK